MRPRFKARTSLLTGKIVVRIKPGTPKIYYDALWLHEKIHQLQRMRFIKNRGKVKGVLDFALCRKNKDCTWLLEQEAYKWEILFLRGKIGRGGVFKEQWFELLGQKGYPKKGLKEMWREIEQIDNGNVPYCLGLFLDIWCTVPF